MKKILTLILLLLVCQLTMAQKGKKKDKNADKTEISANTDTKQNTKNTMILLETTKGNIKIELYNDTPVHSNNFVKLTKEGYYDGMLFHRVIEGFMIQGGDPDSKTAAPGERLGSGGPGYTLPAEIIPNHFHKRGAIAAARTGDQGNPMRRSSGSQFYIVHGQKTPASQLKAYSRYGFEFSDEQLKTYEEIGGAPTLDAQYTVFGEVVDGMEVVDMIASAQKDGADRPKEDIKIIKATVIE
ncbi:MAG: peptidylprolyl isomerase [Bacteroidales bacterium]|nr:peptidylprolyl isomerase [Bacteroidales bacterium]